MNWQDHFAARAKLMRRSALRELMKVNSRPDIISFAGGLPAEELFPTKRVLRATLAALTCPGTSCLQYGNTEGVAELRDWVAQRYSRGRLRLTRENVLITSGSQQALDLCGRILLNSGDQVLVENPTYLAALTAWRPLGARFLGVRADENGMDITEARRLMRRRPRLVYTIPNFQNPQGVTLSRPRRVQLIKLAREHDLPILEDNPYGDLRYEGDMLPHLLDLDATSGREPYAGHVIHAGTFSKVLMPGLRVGWVIAAPAVIDKLVQAKQATDLHTSSFCQQVALELLREGFLDEFLPVLRRSYRERRDAMLAALKKHFPGEAGWTKPEGGLFIFVRLPAGVNAGKLLPQAIENGVAFVPGKDFHVNGDGDNTIRLNFSNCNATRIREGIKRLTRLLVPVSPGGGGKLVSA